MVDSSSDPYSPFHQPIISEDGPQSSEEGSGMHSPVFGAGQYSGHGDSFRYPQDQLDVHHPASMIAPAYDYGHALNVQQPPMLDSTLELPNSSARVPFSSHYQVPPRNQLGIDFPVHSTVHSRISPPAHGVPPIDFRYASHSERRLPGGPSHDQSYARPTTHSSGLPIESEHRPAVGPPNARPETASGSPVASSSSRPTRKETSNVVIACRQCRARKIRCDSTRPVCNNCVRRSNECEYDEKPRRRGPDKRPGTRQRSCKKRPTDGSVPPPSKRKKTSSERPSENRDEVSPHPADLNQDLKHASSSRQLERYPPDFHYHSLHPGSSQALNSPTDLRASDSSHFKPDLTGQYRRSSSYMYDQGSYNSPFNSHQLDVNTFLPADIQRNAIPLSRSIEAEQKMWWDRILRSHPLDIIFDEITFLVRNTGHLLNFVNLDYIMRRIYSEEQRLKIQPAFIYAVLAMAKLMKSSKLDEGSGGLSQAMELVNQAHAAYKDAIELRWFDVTLAEAALILALFESSAHPQHSPERIRTSLVNLDTLIRNLSLTTLDINDDDTCRFSPNEAPVVLTDTPLDTFTNNYRCNCDVVDGQHNQDRRHLNQDYSLPWDPNWSARDNMNEEIRRLSWSALTIISDYISQCETFHEEYPRFYVTEASNFALLFPGQVIDRGTPMYRAHNALSSKESIWALYCRSMLLWNFCNRFRVPSREEERAEHAHEAFLEAQAIEDCLNLHTCNLDTSLIYTSREYIHNTRMLVTQAFRSSFHGLPTGRSTPGPIFKRKQAEDWLFYEDQVIQRVNLLTHQLSTPEGQQLTQRPFRVTWFINQLAICLVLWNHDPTLDDALKLGKSILNPIDVLNALWPCPVIQHKCASLRRQLTEACSSRRMEGPLPEGYAVPPVLREITG
ncbi:hypothetical protein CPB83DRAFT_797695 [Crepidotus variabilis]|uniref:Zn(2)-C6 fungal-type domain-containing protein n=1 Tax=Crepidotus variabilis TaxID=179855 RepID=A0A9P6JKU9_9AGAR|nr:hypothetical protein CPB83DRAFT_797695 [Crepidotus variabilis]